MISMDKTFKCLNGDSADVKFINGPADCPAGVIVGGKHLIPYNLNGLPLYDRRADGPSRLVEVSPYADFVIDEPVMVRDSNYQEWICRLFSGVRESNGFAEADFRPAWVRKTSIGCAWAQCRRPTAEELAS